MCAANDMNRAELERRLVAFDRAVRIEFPDRQFALVLVGGGAMVLLGCLTRATADIDALQLPGDLARLMEEFDISSRANAYINNFAYSFEDRLVPLDVETTSVACFSASLEDIVASKLHSVRPTDEQDVRRPEVLAALDWDVLDRVAADMTESRLNDRQHSEFLMSYRAFREEYGPCDR